MPGSAAEKMIGEVDRVKEGLKKNKIEERPKTRD